MDEEQGVYFEIQGSTKVLPELAGKSFPENLGPFVTLTTRGILPEDFKIDKLNHRWSLKLSELRTEILQQHAKELEGLLVDGDCEMPHCLTIPPDVRAELGIPGTATYYAWCYPAQRVPLKDVTSVHDADTGFLLHGGYAYFNNAGKLLQMTTIAPARTGSLSFGPPKKWNAKWSEPFRLAGRFRPAPLWIQSGVAEYCWIHPSEVVGWSTGDPAGGVICPFGGFAFIFGEKPAQAMSLATIETRKRVVKDLFRKFDTNKNGLIERSELAYVLIQSSKEWTEEKVDEVLRRCDVSKDSKVSYDEFVNWVFENMSSDAVVNNAQGSEKQAPAEVAVAPEPPKEPNAAEAAAELAKQMPELPRICILGGRGFRDPLSERLTQEVAKLCAKTLADRVVILTGGLEGVQETFAKQLGELPASRHLLPVGESSGFGVGQDVAAGVDMGQRMAIFAEIGDLYISVEGGPGVAKEARQAFARGAVLLPMMWTGGASSGLFEFPQQALEQPAYATAEEWTMIKEKGSRDGDDLVTTTGAAVLAVITKFVDAKK